MQFSTLKEKKSAEHIFCILYFTNVKKIISDPSVSSTTLNAKKLSHKFWWFHCISSYLYANVVKEHRSNLCCLRLWIPEYSHDAAWPSDKSPPLGSTIAPPWRRIFWRLRSPPATSHATPLHSDPSQWSPPAESVWQSFSGPAKGVLQTKT